MNPRARSAVRWLAWIGAVALVVLVVSGVYATFRYRPDAEGRDLGMVRLHKWSSYVVGVAAIAVMLLVVPARVVRVWVFTAVFFVAFVFAAASGARLVWDQVGLFAVTQGHDVRGMFFLPHPALFVRVNGHEYSWVNHRNLFWLHSVVLPVVMIAAFTWVVLWARRLGRQPDGESSAATPAAIRR